MSIAILNKIPFSLLRVLETAVIDTIVAEVQSVPGEDRCVLLLGYKTQIVEMFQVNQLRLPLMRELIVIAFLHSHR